MACCRRATILPLPEEVISQIKSSTAVVSLSGVVLELLKNSLDAGATKIEVAVDFGRGACSVDDNGEGIAPLEMREDGGIGKLYCTSKYNSQEAYFGHNGAFLASLAAMSLVTITSRHHEHRSCNSITVHHSKTINRQFPVPPQQIIKHEEHGTRVIVRNLFGNLPVRVKQRAAVFEQRLEQDRLWDTLRRDTTGLILGWGRAVSLRVRDADNKTIFNFNEKSLIVSDSESRTDFHFVLNVLSQANWIDPGDRSSWVPVSASTPNISIKGIISLNPVPTRRVQFISLGLQPLFTGCGHNELYDEINRVFSLSSFGTLEDDADIDENEMLRRQKDRRFKRDGYTNRQLKGRKGVDRYPMFCLRISQKRTVQAQGLNPRFLDDETNLQAVLEVLNAIVTQWLSVHHFKPRKRNATQAPLSATPISRGEENEQSATRPSLSRTPSSRSGSDFSSKPSSGIESTKRRRAGVTSAKVSAETMQQRPFAEWTRIKSGMAQFNDSVGPLAKKSLQIAAKRSLSTPPTEGIGGSEVETTLADVETPCNEIAKSTSDLNVSPANGLDSDDNDDTIHLKDPITKQNIVLNARTGCSVLRDRTKPRIEPSFMTSTAGTDAPYKSVRLPSRSTASEVEKTPWLQGLLNGWENPILKTTEQRIPAVFAVDYDAAYGDHEKLVHAHCSGLENISMGSSMPAFSKMSKEGLRTAQVVSQVDKKFILVKTMRDPDLSINKDRDATVLVLIDQHAADERIRVESLLAELCAPASDTESWANYRSELGLKSSVAFTVLEKPLQFTISSQEHELFIVHAARFSAWGILFDVSSTIKGALAKNLGTRTGQPILSVTALPTVISERGRTDPRGLIAFLRTTVWKYAEGLPPSTAETLPDPASDEPPNWVRLLSSCPPGLVDFVNSRACRSAIMFNDDLTPEQCSELVQSLSQCVFPFVCAHGRPSMVPLIGLECNNPASPLGKETFQAQDNFVDAWKQWKGR